MADLYYDKNEPNSKPAGVSGVTEPGLETIRRFNAGNEEAFGEVYRFLYPHVYYFACRFVDRAEAADMTSDAFLNLWTWDKQFESLQKIRIFLQVCVRNACITHLDRIRMQLRKGKEIAYLLEAFEIGSFESDEVKAALVKKICHEIEKLPPAAKKVFKMSVIDGMDSLEISAKLGVAKSTVRNQKKRAIELIRMAIGNFELTTIFLLISKVITW